MSTYETDKGSPGSTPCTDSQWNCEQRRPTIMNMALFHNRTEGQPVSNWWDNGNNQIAFGRGDKGFIAINNESGSLVASLQTALPASTATCWEATTTAAAAMSPSTAVARPA